MMEQDDFAELYAFGSNTPQILRVHPYWCLWQSRNSDGKPMKIPIDPRTGGCARPNDKSTFAPFEVALRAYQQGKYSGMGIGIFDSIAMLDLDNCVDDKGKLSSLAQDVVSTMGGYSEYSPSGRGLHIFFLAPGFQFDKSKYYINNQKRGMEIYLGGCTSKFVTVTRKALHQLPIADRSKEALAVLEKYMRRDEGKQGTPMASISAPSGKSYLTDDAVIIKASFNLKTGEKFTSLWNGDTSAYGGDKSKADMALCCLLSFWCNRDATQMDRLFRVSGLMRAKWNEQRGAQTYGSMTIQRAIATCKAGYTTEWKG